MPGPGGPGGHHGGPGGHRGGPGGHHGGPGGFGGHRGGFGGPHRPPMGGGRPPMGGGMWNRPPRRGGCCGCFLPVIGVVAAAIGALLLFLL